MLRPKEWAQRGRAALARSALALWGGLAVNLAYAVYTGTLGARTHSVWLAAMCGYHALLGLLRVAVAASRRERTAASVAGVLLVVFGVALGAVCYISQSQNIATAYGTIPMITVATYTFCKIGLAVWWAVTRRGTLTLRARAAEYIRDAEVAGALLTMQRSMLVSFEGMSEENILLTNALTGAGVFLFVLGLGVHLILKGAKTDGEGQNCQDN